MGSMHTIAEARNYLDSSTGSYEKRLTRYRLASRELKLGRKTPLIDLGAGRQELKRHLREDCGWRGSYTPVDAAVDGTDLNRWSPRRHGERRFYSALEVLEHLPRWEHLLEALRSAGPHRLVVTVPDPEQVDTFAMDETHVSAIRKADLEAVGFRVENVSLYGGFYGGNGTDGLLGVYES